MPEAQIVNPNVMGEELWDFYPAIPPTGGSGSPGADSWAASGWYDVAGYVRFLATAICKSQTGTLEVQLQGSYNSGGDAVQELELDSVDLDSSAGVVQAEIHVRELQRDDADNDILQDSVRVRVRPESDVSVAATLLMMPVNIPAST